MTEPIVGPEVYSQKLVSAAKARKFLSQNGHGYVAVSIQDADGNAYDPETLELELWFNDLSGTATDPRGVQVVVATLDTGIVKDDVGKYHYDISPQYTSQKGLISVEWNYGVNGNDFKFMDDMQIQEQMYMCKINLF